MWTLETTDKGIVKINPLSVAYIRESSGEVFLNNGEVLHCEPRTNLEREFNESIFDIPFKHI